MHKFTKRVLTGVVALSLLAPVTTSCLNYNNPITVSAKRHHHAYWHHGLPSYLRGTWRSSKRYKGSKNYVHFSHYRITSWLPKYEPTVDGAGFNRVYYHYSHGMYYIKARETGNAPAGGIPSSIEVRRHRGYHISYREHQKDQSWSHWAYMR